MKISEISLDFIKSFIKVDGDEDDEIIGVILSAATSYLLNYTGRTAEYLDLNGDLTFGLLALIGEMFESRQMTVSNDKVNVTVKSIFDMHCINSVL